ncbi:hypothetical protein [Persicobacter psychrovividus]|uniref:DUF4350 domain-containing protein n=1 Tax=Persicobacter psychrovividus TaxID=387638 RepID=A0ABM7VG12_9BACT|nr:hypothetical protein PEPS_21810 [Persicobacter psychrovividus]
MPKSTIRILAVVALALLTSVFFYSQEHDWTKHYRSYSKAPYGTKIIRMLLQDWYVGSSGEPIRAEISQYSLPEGELVNVLGIAPNIRLSEDEVSDLLGAVGSGHNIVLSAVRFNEQFLKEIGLKQTMRNRVEKIVSSGGHSSGSDSLIIQMKHQQVAVSDFDLWSELAPQLSSPVEWEILARNTQSNAPVILVGQYGEGKIMISSLPCLLSNYHLMIDNDRQAVAGLLSKMPPYPWKISSYFLLGPTETNSLFGFIDASPGLRRAKWVVVVCGFLFLVFGAQRRIGVRYRKPYKENKSRAYIETLAKLYEHKYAERAILLHRKQYLMDYIKKHYLLDPSQPDEDFFRLLAEKSGHTPLFLKRLWEQLHTSRADTLALPFVHVNQTINHFYK